MNTPTPKEMAAHVAASENADVQNAGNVAANPVTVCRLSVARGKADDLGTIVCQQSLTLSELAGQLKLAHKQKVSLEARAALSAARTALAEAKSGDPDLATRKLTTLRKAEAAARARVDRMKRTPWITYATFSGGRRIGEAIQTCTAFMGDADKGARHELLRDRLNQIGCAYIVHTSTSHGCEGEERYRVIIPLQSPLTSPRLQYPPLWQWFNDKLGGILDPGAKDPTRVNYMPRVPTGAKGHQVICVDDRPWFDTSSIAAPGNVILAADPTELMATLTPDQEEDLRSALLFPELLEQMADNRFWSIDVGYALLSLGEKGRELFIWVSQQAPNYEPDAPERWWEQHKEYKPQMDFRHIYKKARELGWTNPRINQVVAPRAFQALSGAAEELALQRYDNGKPLSNVHNAAVALSKQAHMVLTFDEFLDRAMVTWSDEPTRALTDADVTRVQIALQRSGMTSVSATAARDAINLIARRNPTNCVTAWLDQLKWDEKRRLSLLLHLGFGTPITRYYIRAGRNMLLAMAARAYTPGCQVDEALVFEGPQGSRKSSALRILGGSWFAELIADPNSKDFEHQLRGVWLGEFPELHALRRLDDIARIKQFITNREDHYRPPYAREMHDYRRRVVLCGSTNEQCWLHDPTGGRRFIPVEVGDVNLKWLRDNRDQLFAEAVALYKTHRQWWVYPRQETLAHQEARAPEDPWLTKIREYLKGRSEIEASDLLTYALEISAERQNQSQLTRVGIILRKLGCKRQPRRRINGERKSPWTVPPDLAALPCASRGSVALFQPVLDQFPVISQNIRDLL